VPKKKTSWKGTIETKDGATIVKNPKLPIHNTPVLELTEDLVIKGSEEIEEQMFQNIKVFDASGSFQKTIGRKGQGPGEFGMPISLFLSQQNQIIVNDMGQRKVQYFDKEGKYIAQMRFKMNPMIWKKGHLYTIEEDEEGFKVVKRYKIKWKI